MEISSRYLQEKKKQTLLYMHIQLVLLRYLTSKEYTSFSLYGCSCWGQRLNALSTRLLEQEIIKKYFISFKRSACLISNHGQIAFGKNLDNAFELAQEVENICHQYINALRIGNSKILQKRN